MHDKSFKDVTFYNFPLTYLTSSVYLAISWLALFLPPKCIAERLAIAMTILLTLTSMFSSERRFPLVLHIWQYLSLRGVL